MKYNQDNSLINDFLLDPTITFLNHGSFGATPLPVFESYQKWQRELEKQPVEFLGRRATSLLQESRSTLASFLGTDADNIVYVTNATIGLNTVARSLNLIHGDEVLASNHEYGALDRTWRFLSKKHGFKYINVSVTLPVTTTAKYIEDFWKGVTSNTRVIFLSHITSPTALIFPIQEICRRAKELGILTVIDGAHAPGQIPVNLSELDADFYSGNLHKWLCAPKGSAFLYAHPRVQHLIEPLVVSWGWNSDNPGPSQFIDYLEWQGTRDLASFLTIPDAIEYQINHNWDAVRSRAHQLALETQHLITEMTNLQPLSTEHEQWFMQMATSPLPKHSDLNLLKTRLYDEFKIEVPLIQWEEFHLIRYSYQAYNTPKDMERLLLGLTKLLPECTI